MTPPHRLVPLVLAVGIAFTSCRRQSSLAVPEGKYRDGQGLATITVMGRNMDALLEASLAGRKIRAAGRLYVYADGHFTISPVAANHHNAVFGRLDWRWEADHFIVKELDPPGRVLELRRR